MGLQGPFPATLEILTEAEGWDLLGALGHMVHTYTVRGDTLSLKKALKYDKLYAKVLKACGDD